MEDDGTIPFWFEVKDLKASKQYGLQFEYESTNFYLTTMRSGDKEILTITKEDRNILIMTDEQRN